MLKRITFMLILSVVVLLSSCGSPKMVADDVSGENLIIYYAPEAGNSQLLKAAKKYGSTVIYVYKNINGIAVTVPKGKSATEAIKYYEKLDGVLSVTRDQKLHLN